MEILLYKNINAKWDFTGILIIIAVLVLLTYYFCKRHFNYWKRKFVPCEKPHLFLGNIPDIIVSKQPVPLYLAGLYAKYNTQPYFGIYLLGTPALVLRDPKLIKDVLIKKFSNFPNRSFTIDKVADPVASCSLFAVKHQEWKPLRAKLSPIFTSGKLKMMMPLMKECGSSLKKYLNDNPGKTLDMKDVSAKYGTDVISTCTFGFNAFSLENENSEFRAMGKQLFNASLLRKISAFGYFLAPMLVRIFRFSFLDREATVYLTDLFWKVLLEREANNTRRNDLVDILIDLKNSNDDSMTFDGLTLTSQAVAFFSAGYETTSSTISFALYEIAMNEQIQHNLREEIRAVIKKYGDITYDGIKEMAYLDMVISETLRKYTQAPFLIRDCVESYFIPEYNLTIDKGTYVIIPSAGLHTDPKYYPDPMKFDPSRFNEENQKTIDPYTYLPFGGGPRNCIGERFARISAKLAIVYIIKDFKVLKSNETPDKLIFNHQSLLLESKGGLYLKLQKLSQ